MSVAVFSWLRSGNIAWHGMVMIYDNKTVTAIATAQYSTARTYDDGQYHNDNELQMDGCTGGLIHDIRLVWNCIYAEVCITVDI